MFTIPWLPIASRMGKHSSKLTGLLQQQWMFNVYCHVCTRVSLLVFSLIIYW